MDALLFDLGTPKRRPATQDEIAEVLKEAVNLVVVKYHRGRPPKQMEWEDFKQEISARAVWRLRNFRHGGSQPLRKFAIMAAYFSLVDIQRETFPQSDSRPYSRPAAEARERELSAEEEPMPPLLSYIERRNAEHDQ